MTSLIANVASSTDSFAQWLTKTNQALFVIKTKAVTTDSNTAVGNAAVSNRFTANTLVGNNTLLVGYGSSNIVGNSTSFVIQTSPTVNTVITGAGIVINGTTQYTASVMRIGNTTVRDGNVTTANLFVSANIVVGNSSQNTVITNDRILTYYSNTRYFYAVNTAIVGDLEANTYQDRNGIQVYANPTGSQVQNSKMTSVDLWIANIHSNTQIEANNISISGKLTGNINFEANSHFTSGNNYFDHGLTSNADIRIITTNPSANAIMLLKSGNYAGIHVVGDANNTAGEPGGAFVAFYLDGGDPTSFNQMGYVGVIQDAVDDLYGDGQTITEGLASSTVFGSRNNDAQIVAGNKATITVLKASPSNKVGINTNAPANILDIKPGEIRLRGSSTGYAVLKVAAAAGSPQFTLPTTVGVKDQILSTDGAGVMSWVTPTQLGLTSDIAVRSVGVGVAAPGPSNPGQLWATRDIISYYSSDRSLKENIKPINNALDKVMQINGVTFDWKQEVIDDMGGEDDYFVRKHDVGVIAQEVEAVLPEVVAERDDGIKAVKYEKLVALLIEAVKQLKHELDEIKNVSKK